MSARNHHRVTRHNEYMPQVGDRVVVLDENLVAIGFTEATVTEVRHYSIVLDNKWKTARHKVARGD